VLVEGPVAGRRPGSGRQVGWLSGRASPGGGGPDIKAPEVTVAEGGAGAEEGPGVPLDRSSRKSAEES